VPLARFSFDFFFPFFLYKFQSSPRRSITKCYEVVLLFQSIATPLCSLLFFIKETHTYTRRNGGGGEWNFPSFFLIIAIQYLFILVSLTVCVCVCWLSFFLSLLFFSF
jgi:hypothetical protein